jgi:hypothetical protein
MPSWKQEAETEADAEADAEAERSDNLKVKIVNHD